MGGDGGVPLACHLQMAGRGNQLRSTGRVSGVKYRQTGGVSVVSKAGRALLVASSVSGTMPALRDAKKEIGARLHNGQEKRK